MIDFPVPLGDGVSLFTDGLLSSSSDEMALLGIRVLTGEVDSDRVADDGGWRFEVSGVFPEGVDFEVAIVSGSDVWPCYSGIAGQGNVIKLTASQTLEAVSPPLPRGTYDVRVTTADAVQTATLAGVLKVMKRSYPTGLYRVRGDNPPPRDVGAYRVEEERGEGERRGLLAGVLSGLVDVMYEQSGHLLGRTSDSYVAGGTTLPIAELHRWPESGRIVVAGQIVTYGERVMVDGIPTGLGDLEDEDGDAGIPVDLRAGTPVLLLTPDTALERVKSAFFIETAEGADLTTFARNYGWDRPFFLGDDDLFRSLLLVLLFLKAGTIYAIERVMDVLRPGGYEIREYPAEPNLVDIIVQPLSSDSYRGKAFLVGLEEQATVGATVEVDFEPLVVSGIWDVADPNRIGTNYAEATIPATAEDDLLTTASPWEIEDIGKTVYDVARDEVWTVLAFLDATTVQIGMPTRNDATLNAGLPDVIVADEDVFREWMVGHGVRVGGVLNAGTYTIAEFISTRKVRLTGAAFVTETDATWAVVPQYPPTTSYAARIGRATWAGTTITAPSTLPADVLVDYATVPSGQAQRSADVSADDAFAFYLYDDSGFIQALIDQITYAGVEARVKAA